MGANNQKQEQKGKGTSQKQLYTKDGCLVEEVSKNGEVFTVQKHPQFIRDVCPNFSNSIMLIIMHLLYRETQNPSLILFLLFGLITVMGLIGPSDNQNISKKNQKEWENDKRFLIPLYFFMILETASQVYCLVLMSDTVGLGYEWKKTRPSTWSQYIIFSFIFSAYSGAIAGVVGHELLHRKETINKVIGTFGQTKFFYSHFFDEHLKGHHKTLGTKYDPATAKKGQNLYSFIIQSFIGSHKSVWNMETSRIKKQMGKDISLLETIVYNKMTHYFCIHLTMVICIYATLGWSSVKFQFMYSAICIFQVENVNYCEHYGIERKKDQNGIFESIGLMHSWNSKSGAIVVRLQRHSDHHAHRFRPYQILRRLDEGPYLPFDYTQSMILCTIPPLWFYMLDPKVDALKDLSDGKKNIKTKYNQMMPMTQDDQKRKNAGWATLGIIQILLAYGMIQQSKVQII